MEAVESTLLDFVEKMRAWIPGRADPSNISRDFWMSDHSCRVCYECDWQFTLLNQPSEYGTDIMVSDLEKTGTSEDNAWRLNFNSIQRHERDENPKRGLHRCLNVLASSNASTLRKGVASSNATTSPGVLSSTPWLAGFERRKVSWSTALLKARIHESL